MSAISTEEHEAGGSSSPTEGMSVGQRCQSIDSLAEWRSSEQVENGIPSTSPPFWDTDDDDECGPKPSELYGKFTWKIDNFRQLNKRELRSDPFEVGGYKWYILIYPQGCDVCNHLSLFLCVANHDKLLPGWSHFAQFTIAVVNKDSKKSKFSDTLHRFCKKEHDWGWKKFMEINKVYDGFVNDDSLVIKAQVQVIREKANRPFRCLDCQYRRELVRVYLSNVEQICRRFIEDRKNKLGKLIEDKMRWSSFRAFWTGIDQASRRRMSRDKSDTILRVVVKNFFVEKEVTSTLVMDSLHSGLKALEHQSKNKKGKLKIEMEDSSHPMVRVENDMFVLDDDVVLLIDRVASDPLPTTSLPPKDDKVSLNRAKEGSCCEEFNKESIERDERRLTELGQRTIEIFVIAHIFSSRIEVAYQEAVALKRQEELIREEEAAGQAEHELKAKRAAADKEKRAKKKQTKQKRNNRKSKDQQRYLKSALTLKKRQPKNSDDEIVSCELSSSREQFMSEKMDMTEDASDVSYAGEDVAELLHPHLDDRDGSPENGDADASEVHRSIEARLNENSNELPEKIGPIIDDSSSTCSTDSVPSVVSNGSSKGFSGHNNISHTSPNRGKNQLGKALLGQESLASHFGDAVGSGSSSHGTEADAAYLKLSMLHTDKRLVEKHEEAATLPKIIIKVGEDAKRLLSSFSSVEVSSPSARSVRKPKPPLQPKKLLENGTAPSNTATSVAEPVQVKELPATNPNLNPRPAAVVAKSPQSSSSKSEVQRVSSSHIAKSATVQPSNAISRPSSAPLIPAASRPTRPIVPKVQKLPQLLRSVSAAGRLGIDPSASTPSSVPQSYRNAIIGKTTMGSHPASVSSSEAPSTSSTQSAATFTSTPMPPPPTPGARKEHQINLTFGSVKPDVLPNQHERRDDGLQQAAASRRAPITPTTCSDLYTVNRVNGVERLKICDDQQPEKQSSCNAPLVQPLVGGVVDEFPHIDIINDLLNDEQSIMGREASSSNPYYLRHPSFSRQYSFPGDITSCDVGLLATNNSGRYEQAEQYYDDGFQSIYSSSSVSPLHGLREGQFPQMDLPASYAVGPMDGMVQIHWPYSHGADLSTVNLGSGGADGYSYQQFSGYSSLGRGANGYGMYRP